MKRRNLLTKCPEVDQYPLHRLLHRVDASTETLRQENKFVAFEMKWKRRKKKDKKKKKEKAWTHVYKFCFRFASSVRSHLYLGGTAIIAPNTEEGRNWRTPKKPKKRSGIRIFDSLLTNHHRAPSSSGSTIVPLQTVRFQQFSRLFFPENKHNVSLLENRGMPNSNSSKYS